MLLVYSVGDVSVAFCATCVWLDHYQQLPPCVVNNSGVFASVCWQKESLLSAQLTVFTYMGRIQKLIDVGLDGKCGEGVCQSILSANRAIVRQK
jgi:hypothetical protein